MLTFVSVEIRNVQGNMNDHSVTVTLNVSQEAVLGFLGLLGGVSR